MTGQLIAFWIFGPVAVLAALGLVVSRKAVHGALCLATVMISLAVLYIAQEAPFLGVVQVVVYTGAVMMLFLFVLMLVGVDSSDSLVETIKGQRWAALLGAVALGAILVATIGRVEYGTPTGVADANPAGNVPGVAELVFGRYVWAFEVVAAVLITAALGAMVLAHRERLQPKVRQRELSERRLRPRDGDLSHVAPLPSPGVYARHNAVDTPALLPDGSPSELSTSRVLAARGAVRSVTGVADDVSALVDHDEQVHHGSAERRPSAPTQPGAAPADALGAGGTPPEDRTGPGGRHGADLMGGGPSPQESGSSDVPRPPRGPSGGTGTGA